MKSKTYAQGRVTPEEVKNARENLTKQVSDLKQKVQELESRLKTKPIRKTRTRALNKIKTVFNELVNKGREGAFVIFTSPETDKFVQFVYDSKERWLICDIPLIELSEEEKDKIKVIMEEGSATDMDTGEQVSYQWWFTVDDIDRATKLVKTVFIDIFNLPESYSIKSELILDGMHATVRARFFF